MVIQNRRSTKGQILARLVSVGLAVACPARASDVPLIEDTPEAACKVLMEYMARVEQLPDGKPYERWFCDTNDDNPLLYLIGLRSLPEPEQSLGDHTYLVGWFAVARRSTVVLQYDVAADRLVPVTGYAPSD